MIVRAGVTLKPAIERALAGLDMSKVLGLDAERDGRPDRRGLRRATGTSQDEDRGVRNTRAMQLFNRYVSTRSLTVFAGELCLIFGSVALAAVFQNTPDLAVEFVEDRPRHGRLPVVPLLQRLLRSDPRAFQPRTHRPAAAGGRRGLHRARRPVLRRSRPHDRRRHLRLVALRVPGRHPRLAAAFNRVTGSLEMDESAGSVVGTGETARSVVAARSSTSMNSPTASSGSSTTTSRASASGSSIPASSARRRTFDRLSPPPDRSHHRRPVGPARQAARRRTAAREAGRRQSRGRHDNVRADHGQDPDRRPSPERG